MTSMDPPRLRSQRGLPEGLAVALSSKSDDLLPGPNDLRDLERGVLSAAAGIATVAAAASAGHSGKLAIASKLLTIKLGIWVLPALGGAGLGVCVLGASHLIQTARSHDPPPSVAVTIEGAPAPRSTPRGTKEHAALPSAPVFVAAPAPAPSASGWVAPRAARDAVGAQDGPTLGVPPADVAQAEERALAPLEPTVLPEVDLIEQAHRALANDLVRAQSFVSEHEHRFPDGTFAQEREAIAIEVLVRRGDTVDARARAARFFVRFPGSTYAERIESMVRANGVHKN